MITYNVKKVLNNNVVIAEYNKEEFILVGKAIGFDSNKDKKVSEDRVENIFVKQTDKLNGNFDRILKEINSEIVGVSEEIIAMCEKELGETLKEAIHVSLPDHINFAILRSNKGMRIENPFISEIRTLYPKEFSLAEQAVSMLDERFKIRLPYDEVGFICMHIKAALSSQDVGETLEYTKKISEIIELISALMKKKLDRKSLEYERLLTHINFLVERLTNNKATRNPLLETIKKEFSYEYAVAIKVAMKIQNLFSVKVSDDEIGYIAIHLRRLAEM